MIVKFEPEHLLSIRHQRWQDGSNQSLQHATAVANGYCAYTALCKETGRPLICAGIVEFWPDRAMCWASFDYESKSAILTAHRRTVQELDQAPFKRLEMYVAPGFIQGWRWAEMLGFQLECLMESGSPDGRDLLVFKRIKRGAATRRLS